MWKVMMDSDSDSDSDTRQTTCEATLHCCQPSPGTLYSLLKRERMQVGDEQRLKPAVGENI